MIPGNFKGLLYTVLFLPYLWLCVLEDMRFVPEKRDSVVFCWLAVFFTETNKTHRGVRDKYFNLEKISL